MFRTTFPMARVMVRMPRALYSTKPAAPGLTAKLFTPEKDSITEKDVDEWLEAVSKLKKGKGVQVTTPAEVYLSQVTQPEQFLETPFEPTEQQLAEVAAFENVPIPVKDDPTVSALINIIMRDGRKSKAEKVVTRALYMVYLKTRKNPVELLEETLDKMAPVVTTRVEKTGFAKNKVVPVPLTKKQRNRLAITWILDGAAKKKSNDAAVRLAEEIVAAYEGKSSGYDKLSQMHKTAIQQRAYIKF
ncbi:small ribosomal subunit protein uS7m [Diutina catenulata]